MAPAAPKPLNPIIPGYAPDPSVVLVDDTFFLVNSTFHTFPGLPIYTSKDLKSWQHIGNAINRQSQLSFAHSESNIAPVGKWGEVMCANGGLYAPTIRYHNDTFYVVCTNVVTKTPGSPERNHENFIVTSTDIYNDKWSDPVFFDFNGIDTSLFWDNEGRAYIHGSASPGPMTKIKMFEIDTSTGKKLCEEKVIWEGTGGIYPEGPHIYKKDGYHYLVISEGGTYELHMITAARSEDLWGPYEACPDNPILTARDTDEYIQHTGHSEFFSDKDANWWAVCLGVRKDKEGRYIMGRETFLTPGTWPEGGWPKFDRVKMDPKFPDSAANSSTTSTPASGITVAKPGIDLNYIRNANLAAHKISHSSSGTTIALTPSTHDLSTSDSSVQVTFVGKRQRSLVGSSTTTLVIPSSPATQPVKAGLAIYKDEHRFARLSALITTTGVHIEFQLHNAAKKIFRTAKTDSPVNTDDNLIELRLDYTETSYEFFYHPHTGDKGRDGGWIALGQMDTLELSGMDFVGPIIGVFAVVEQGDEGSSDGIEFRGLDVE